MDKGADFAERDAKEMKAADGKHRVLIVEDESLISEVCRRLLTREGLEVDVAPNGRVAQRLIAEKPYDLCLMDIRMPIMNGKELFSWLREQHPRLSQSVVFISGDLLGSDTRVFLQGSCRPFLPKPFSSDDLIAIVRDNL